MTLALLNGKNNPVRRRVAVLIAAVLVAAALAVGIPLYNYFSSYVSTDDAFIEGCIIPISPRISGHVARVHVTDNQRVEAGDLLAEIRGELPA